MNSLGTKQTYKKERDLEEKEEERDRKRESRPVASLALLSDPLLSLPLNRRTFLYFVPSFVSVALWGQTDIDIGGTGWEGHSKMPVVLLTSIQPLGMDGMGWWKRGAGSELVSSLERLIKEMLHTPR